MTVRVQFFSYFKQLASEEQLCLELPQNASIGDLLECIRTRFPKLAALNRSTLVAVGMEYAGPNQMLNEGDVVSLFPPVQGG